MVLLLAAVLCAEEAYAASPLDLEYKNIEWKADRTEGTLVLSDSPEYADCTGILAEGTIDGKGRVYYYHVNSTGKRARLVMYAVSQNKTRLEVTKFLQGVPSADYVTSGASLSYSEMVSVTQKPFQVELAPGKRTILAEEAPGGLLPDYLYTGILEVKTEEPVRFGTALLPMTGDDGLQGELDRAEPQPVDSHEMRGTFPMAVYRESRAPWNTDKDGPAAIEFGSSSGHDFYMGMDELDGTRRENTGDYGMSFTIQVPTEGTKPFRVYLNPMGGVYMGSFRLRQGFLPHYYRTDDMKYGGRWLGDGTIYDFMDMGLWQPGKPLTIEFIPAGATYFPIRFLFVPEGAL